MSKTTTYPDYYGMVKDMLSALPDQSIVDSANLDAVKMMREYRTVTLGGFRQTGMSFALKRLARENKDHVLAIVTDGHQRKRWCGELVGDLTSDSIVTASNVRVMITPPTRDVLLGFVFENIAKSENPAFNESFFSRFLGAADTEKPQIVINYPGGSVGYDKETKAEILLDVEKRVYRRSPLKVTPTLILVDEAAYTFNAILKEHAFLKWVHDAFGKDTLIVKMG